MNPRTRVISIVGAVALAHISVPLSAPIIGRPDVADSLYRALGARAEFASVGHVIAGGSDASGVLIAPHWMITAAHVVHDTKAGNVFVEIGGRRFGVRRALEHPQYLPSRTLGGMELKAFDVALLELDADAAVPPAQLMSTLPTVGSLVTVVGYGATHSSTSAARDTSPHIKRAARNRVDQVGGVYGGDSLPAHLVMIDLDIPGREGLNASGTSDADPLEGVCTGGDSGGGMFAQVNDVWMLAATFSTGAYNMGDIAASGTYAGTRNIHVAVAAHRLWIRSVTGVP